MKTSALALLLLAAASSVAAQSQVPYIETFEVRLHNLDVVVTDAKGQPVHGLTEHDFVVLENGTNQPITNFSSYDTNAAIATNAASDVAVMAEAVRPPRRHFVFYIDDLQLRRELRVRLYERLSTFIGQMSDDDVASVVRPTAEKKVVQEFTADRATIARVLKQAIDESVTSYTGFKLDIARLENALGRGEPAAIAHRDYTYSVRRRVEHRLGQLRALTSSLGRVEGRKILIMVTEGIPSEPGSEVRSMEQTSGLPVEGGLVQLDEGSDDYTLLQSNDRITRNYQRTIDDIARSAAANGVTIYALEPNVHLELAAARGSASTPSKKGAASGGGHFGPDYSRSLPTTLQTDLMQNSAATLDSLSGRTGGKWFRGITGIDETFRQVSTDLSTYYSLAYRATGAENGPRRVQVQVRNRPELRVRTRSEVLQKSTAREMDDLVVASLVYPQPVNELAVNVTAGAPVKARGYYTIPLDIVLPMSKLTFLPSNDGSKYVASFDVHFALAGVDRDFLQGGKTEQIIEITPEQYGQLGTVNYRYKTGINVSKGSSKIAIGLIDDTTKLTGFGTVDVVTR
jgi:VWFA-related protein